MVVIFWKLIPRLVLSNIFLMDSAVFTGKVDFSTTILSDFATLAICRAHCSTYLRSDAIPLPAPYVFVGVFTEIKIISAISICFLISEEKCRFFPLHNFIISLSPGSNIGNFDKSIPIDNNKIRKADLNLKLRRQKPIVNPNRTLESYMK